MSSARDIELLEADARYYRDRVALLRAGLYGWGQGSTPQLQELERRLGAPSDDCASSVHAGRAELTVQFPGADVV